MGLDCSHNAWKGAYSAFMRWRQAIAQAAGYDLNSIWEKHAGDGIMGRWKNPPEDPLVRLLNHSDCDGMLPWLHCGEIADRLESLLPKLEVMGDGGGHIGGYADKTRQFITGLREARASHENLDFY